VLFSREDVSAFINRNFEPAWETVRPVPIVRIDFGNGNAATRTLHGNVASYVCSADGKVADIVPGIYTPAAYLAALEPMRELVGALSRLAEAQRLAPWRAYHRANAQRLANVQVVQRPAPNAANREGDPTKKAVELRVERRIVPNPNGLGAVQAQAPAPRPRNAAELASWQPLAADTLLNETQRRLQIHQRFATTNPVQPEQIKRWLYRDVLHADLDDPTMGLGDDFFADLEP
jgi:hypothetical protein